MSEVLPSSLLASLPTECRNDKSSNIDTISSFEICRIINQEDITVAPAVEGCLADISRAIDLIADRVRHNGRVVYIGAGTSGRQALGVLDASEISPTFSAPYSQFLALIAGGDSAIRRATEGAEDSTKLPIDDLLAISPPLNSVDTLIGIAASGRTPYVLAGLSYAHDKMNMLTVGISCVNPSQMRGRCDSLIECVVGAEIVTGSTRMKAGTATKMILNMISTGVMIRVGKTYGNMMVDVKVSNHKLVDRARRIFRTLLPSAPLSDLEIDSLIESCKGSVKLALVVGKLGCTVEAGSSKLDAAGGILKIAWEESPVASNVEEIEQNMKKLDLVLCIDAGGTKCSAVIAGKDGLLARASGGPCNFVTLGHDSALSTISSVTARAIELLPSQYHPQSSSATIPGVNSIFAAAWIGGAGLDRAVDLESTKLRIACLLSLEDPFRLWITNDAALLSSAIALSSTINGTSQTGVVLIMGTGSMAYSFVRPSENSSSLPIPLDRAGGWGYLLGDEGSAYSIGRDAIRAVLRARDIGLSPTAFHLSVMEYFGCKSISEIISAVYTPSSGPLERSDSTSSINPDPKLRISGLCPVIFRHAFPHDEEVADNEAFSIVQVAANASADTVITLLENKSPIFSARSTLVMGGALAQVTPYMDLVVRELSRKGHVFALVHVIPDAVEPAARLLVKEFLQ